MRSSRLGSASQGVELPRKQRKGKSGLQWKASLDASDIEELLAGDLPHPGVRSALEIRLQAAQSAASKIDRMLRTRCADGRVRGLFRFHGATTGRWSGAGFQPQNLKRPEIIKTDEAIAEAIQLVKAEDHTALKERYNDVLGVIGDLCRSMIVPAPGHRFIVGDFSAIEARVLAFLAGDADKLEAFRQFDLGLGRDIYCITAEQVLGLADVQDKSPERQLGKIFELGLGYSMGADRLLATIRQGQRSQRCGHYPRGRGTMGADMARQEPAHRRILGAARCGRGGGGAQSWNVFPCRNVSFQMRDGVLSLRLPSGRELSYPAPSLEPGRFGQTAADVYGHGSGTPQGKAHVRRGLGGECHAGRRARSAG